MKKLICTLTLCTLSVALVGCTTAQAKVAVPSSVATAYSSADSPFGLAQSLDVVDKKFSVDVFPAGMEYAEYSKLDAILCTPDENSMSWGEIWPKTMVLYGVNEGYDAFDCIYNPRDAGRYFDPHFRGPSDECETLFLSIRPANTPVDETEVGLPCAWASKDRLSESPAVPKTVLLYGTGSGTAQYVYTLVSTGEPMFTEPLPSK